MAKVRRIKKRIVVIVSIIGYIMVYIASVKYFTKKEGEILPNYSIDEEIEDTRSLIDQLCSNNKTYISDSNISDIKIEEGYWDPIESYINEFVKIREGENFTPIYSGYNEDGVKFETNMDIFRIYTVTEEEFYKIPVSEKDNIASLFRKSIYTSFDFIKQYDTWKNVSITHNDKSKKIYKWNYDELAYNMASKRIVGYVQPEKGKERSEHHFTINIVGDNYEATIETMGDDYIKISSNEGETYYEVPNELYNYLKDEIFKI